MRRASIAAFALLAAAASVPREPDGPTFHFAYDVLPLLQRAGCSAADCHGGATGRGGFKLSLFASDPRADHAAVTIENDGRRIDLLEPERSLLLRKPTRDLDHGGGRRLAEHGRAYERIAGWIRAGAPFAAGEPPQLVDLRVVRERARVRATATFVGPDQRRMERDVSDSATFTSTDERVAAVDADGGIDLRGSGAAWILARYAHLSASARIVTPFDACVAARDVQPRDHFLDTAWRTDLAELGLEPAPRAGERTIARRLWLDLIGRTPSPAEVERFVAIPERERVREIAHELSASQEFERVFADHLASMFEIEPPHAEEARHADRNARLRAEIAAALRRRAPWSEFVAAAIAPTGGLARRFADPRDRAEFAARSALGLSIGCARCHDHPLDRWRRDEHLRFSALFTDERPAADVGMIPATLFDPETGRAVAPAVLPLETGDGATDPGDLDGWLAHGSVRRASSLNLVNRVFAVLLGRGLVEPLDDHRASNPPVLGRVLSELTERFEANGQDLRALVVDIVTSELYACASEPDGDADLDLARERWFARRAARPLGEAAFHASLAHIVGRDLGPPPAPAASPLAATLHLLNGDLVPNALSGGGTAIDAIADFVMEPGARADALCELVLGRPPDSAERALLAARLESSPDARATCRDIAFALLCSREFHSIR